MNKQHLKEQAKKELINIFNIAKGVNYDFKLLATKLNGYNYNDGKNGFFDFDTKTVCASFYILPSGKAKIGRGVDLWENTENDFEIESNVLIVDIFNKNKEV